MDENRLSHMLGWAELDGLICSGANEAKKTTFSLLADRVKVPKPISDELALLRLTERYFLSHGPATAADFSWWSGLTLTQARKGIEMVGKKLVAEKIDGKEFFMEPSLQDAAVVSGSVHLLPSYDEFIIAYSDRSMLIPSSISKEIISINGIFRPVVLVDGKVQGTWGKEVRFFSSVSKKVKVLVAKKLEEHESFLGE